MEIKKELKEYLLADKIKAIISIIIWFLILFYILYKIIVGGVNSLKIIDWILGCVGVLFIVYGLFRFCDSRKKLKELQ